MAEQDFAGKTVFITGAARGQGRSHALEFAARGANLVLADRCADVAVLGYPQATSAEFAQTIGEAEALGAKVVHAVLDTVDRAAVQALVDTATETFGGIDVAVANAGVTVAGGVQSISQAGWDEVIGSNLTGVFNTVAAVAPGMVERKYGRIITISSMLGRQGSPGMVGYVSSKWGVIGMTKSVALELAPHGVTANVIAPGNIATPMAQNDALYAQLRPDLEHATQADAAPVLSSLHPIGVPWLEPSEITRVVTFLAAEGSAHISGIVVPVDAGNAGKVTG